MHELLDIFLRLDTPLLIFGAGLNGRKLLSALNNNKITVRCFIDNDFAKQGTVIDGVPVLSLETAGKTYPNGIIVVSPEQNSDIILQLKNSSYKQVIDGNKLFGFCRRFLPTAYGKEYGRNLHPFNHYESPYPDIETIRQNEERIFEHASDALGIDFHDDDQLALWDKMQNIPLPNWSKKPDEQYRYYYDNEYFGSGSAQVLYRMIRILQPRRIIEIGSGFSTAVMLDTNEKYFDNAIKICSIEPNADRLKQLLKPDDNIQIQEKSVQEIPPPCFLKSWIKMIFFL